VGYGDKDYWEERYAGVLEPEEWLQSWKVLRPLIAPLLPPTGKILILGCGTSPLGEDLWDDGWHDVLGVDYSPLAVARMQARAAGRPGLAYREMDVCALDLADGSFDAAIDKGTLDAVLCGKEPQAAAQRMVAEIGRVLSPHAAWACVSMRPERNRAHLFGAWRMSVSRVPKLRGANAPPVVDEEDEMNNNWVYLLSR
jgi:EEF1A lysine methyltransferase 4